jgi:hypothetical protein
MDSLEEVLEVQEEEEVLLEEDGRRIGAVEVRQISTRRAFSSRRNLTIRTCTLLPPIPVKKTLEKRKWTR